MKNLKKFFIVVLMLFSLGITFFPFNYVIADVGSFESYDSSDWDSWDSGSSWDSWDYDDDYGYSSGSLSGGETVIVIVLTIVGIIVLSIIFGRKDNNRKPTHTTTNTNNETEIENKVKAIDELFNKDDFKSWAKDLFIKLQYAWTARDWSVIRCFESNELFELHSTQLQGYINNKQINVLERVAVNEATLYNFRQSGDKDILEVLLKTKMIDYIIDEDTKQVLKGSKDKNLYNTYKLTFMRKTGVKTKPGENTVNTTNCPNCGAPTKITSSGECEYCGSVITTGEYDWVLTGLERF